MIVYHRLDELPRLAGGAVVAIGNFDGIHLGHQRLLASVVERAALTHQVPALLTFFPHPVEILRPHTPLRRLTTASEKLALLESAGVHLVLVAAFDKETAAMEPADFFEKFIAQGIGARAVHVGFNFRFGKNRQGDTDTLEALCKNRGISLHVEPAVEVNAMRCSSSAIRTALQEGSLDAANALLGRPYAMTGQVVRGEGRGRKIGFPTANMRLPAEKLLPRSGVYVTEAVWQRQKYRAVANLGLRPTFKEGETIPVLEVHFLDFDASLYDEFVEISFVQRIRDEKKFDSVEGLKEQIAKDVAWARAYQL
jgi:riboflavin kinase / FMN adenylyltransferase